MNPDTWIPPAAAGGISVVIVNWNTAALLRDCLGSLYRHAGRSIAEAIVVDNASTDGSPEMVRREFPGVRLLVNDRNEGFAAGCNRGMRVAGGRRFLLLNSDTVCEDDPVAPLEAALDRHPRAGIAGGALRYADGSPQPSCGRFPTLGGALASNLRPPSARRRALGPQGRFVYPFCTYGEHAAEREVEWVSGALLLVRREAAAAVGPMDESIFLFAEEWEWCRRFRAAGWSIVHAPGGSVVHLGSGSWTLGPGLLTEARRAGIWSDYRRHHGALSSAAYLAVGAAGAAAKTLAWSSIWLARPGRRREAAERVRWNLAACAWAFRRDSRRPVRAEDLAAPARPFRGSPAP